MYMFRQKIAKGIVKLIGWKCECLTPDYDKCILVVAPHTSNWDFIMGEVGYTALGRSANFVIKEGWMKWPIGPLIRKLGGIPVDRSRANHFTDQIADIYRTHQTFRMAITPEGTRKRNPKWKKGFYHIAMKAEVPIVLVKIDYGKKLMSLFHVFEPTGDEMADIKAIQKMFKGVTAKHPQQFALPE